MEISEGVHIGLPGVLLALAGAALMTRLIRRRLRRLRSHRQTEDGMHHWIEFDGTTRSSRMDPRDSWSSDGPDHKGDRG